MKFSTRFLLLPLFALSTQCAVATEGPAQDREPTTDSTGTQQGLSVDDDDLNGLWRASVDGTALAEPSVIESWPAVGIRLDQAGASYSLTRTADSLAAPFPPIALTILANKYGVNDDQITGTLDGHTLALARDTRQKPPITLGLSGDRPYRAWLVDELMPAAQRDRESFTSFQATKLSAFLKSCELYKSGSFQYKFIKGDTASQRSYNFLSIAYAIDKIKTTPRRLTKEKKFLAAVNANLKDPSLAGLAISTFSMYFSTGAGRSVRIPIGDDSMIYFITDRPSRAERIGLSVMQTPLHGPLASTFGRQLLDLGAMPQSDDSSYARTLLEIMTKSDASRAKTLSPTGRSALTDWFAVMAIEDYRGMAFGWPTLSWGSNMTNVQLYGLVVRALARPGATDLSGAPVAGQVLVGNELRPGEPSYADVLNGGADMQEYSDMSNLKLVASKFLRAKHPVEVAALEAALAPGVPKSELGGAPDLFRWLSAQFYDASGRGSNLDPTQVVNAATALVDVLRQDSAGFEAYILASGYTKSNVAAPKSTGY